MTTTGREEGVMERTLETARLKQGTGGIVVRLRYENGVEFFAPFPKQGEVGRFAEAAGRELLPGSGAEACVDVFTLAGAEQAADASAEASYEDSFSDGKTEGADKVREELQPLLDDIESAIKSAQGATAADISGYLDEALSAVGTAQQI